MNGITNLEFLCKSENEFINYGDFQLPIPVGCITQSIALLPEHVLTHIKENMLLMKGSIMEAPKLNLETQHFYKKYNQCLGIVDQFFESISLEIKSLDNPLYANLLFIFPLARAIMGLHTHYHFPFYYERLPKWRRQKYSNYKDLLKASFKYSIEEIKSDPFGALKDCFFTTEKKLSHNEEIFQNLEFFYNRIVCPQAYALVSYNKMEGYFNAIIQYIDHIVETCDEILFLQKAAAMYIHTNADILELSKEYNWDQGEILLSQNYNVPSVKYLFLSEIKHLKENNYSFKKCDLCGKTFVTNLANAKYCTSPNRDHNYKTCAEVAEVLSKKADDPIYKHFDKKRREYRNWMNNQRKQYPDLFNSNYANAIFDEMDHIYQKWATAISSVVFDYQFEKIDYDSALEQIKLPGIEDRSPLLAKLKYDFKHQ